MKKNILAVCDLEEQYARQLMDYLNLKENVPFEVHAFSDLEELKKFLDDEKIDILLISENAMEKELEEYEIDEIFILSEGADISQIKGYKSIYKYQTTENILREVMFYYAENKSAVNPKIIPVHDMDMIAVYSPVKRSLKTSFCITMGQILAEKKKTLYINLEDYAGFNTLFRTTYMTDMSDLMYYISREKPNFIWKLASMVQTMGKLDYIPPALSPIDIRNIRGDQWLKFFRELKKCNYEAVVLDMGEAVDGVFDILRMCKMIYTPTRDDGISYAKIEQYEALLKIMDYEDVIEKTRKLSFSYFSGVEKGLDRLVYTDLGAYARMLLETDGLI